MADKTVSDSSMLRTLLNLWPYMWPQDRMDLKMRVVWAAVLLVVAKLVLMLVPYFFKWATNALGGELSAPAYIPALLIAPVMLVVAYNFVRVAQLGFNQMRDALFARVGQYAVRQLAYRTFVHMHELSLRFHLERRTGGLSRIIERGTKGIETIVRYTILNTAPTILEFALTAIIFAFTYGLIYVAVVAVTVALYTWFTVWASDWRIAIRREMNDSDTDANTKAIDSLLNFETVKYFSNEAMEAPFRSLHGALRSGGDQDLDLARLAELRPGRHLLDRHGRMHGAIGSCGGSGHADDRRFRLHQRHADAAFRAAQFHRLHLP